VQFLPNKVPIFGRIHRKSQNYYMIKDQSWDFIPLNWDKVLRFWFVWTPIRDLSPSSMTTVPPTLILNDHRHVTADEISSNPWYVAGHGGPPHLSSIFQLATTNSHTFLRSISKWNETHLIAFKGVLLENLPVSRVLPDNILPAKEDNTTILGMSSVV
jgi:hypothetical protein